jgi:hypothetical protein
MDHLRRKMPDRDWTTGSTRKLLARRVYLGEVSSGELANEAAHAPLTTPGDWIAAQTPSRGQRRRTAYVLSGLATCAGCGGPMTGQTIFLNGDVSRHYRCGNPGGHRGVSVDADKLEAFVRDELANALGVQAFRVRFAPVGLEEAAGKLEQARAERDAYAAKTSALSDGFQAGAEQRDRAVADAQARYDELAVQSAQAEDLPAANELHKPARFQRALRAAVDRIVIHPGRGPVADVDDGGRVELVWKGLDRAAGMVASQVVEQSSQD